VLRDLPQRRNLLQTLWLSRKLVAAAALVGVLFWFIVTNNQAVTVHLPFGLGQVASTVGVIVLASAAVGSVATALILTLVWALRRYRPSAKTPFEPTQTIASERPPDDYAAHTAEGFSDAPWTAR
jgi:uncharacterized integral membrane protein